VFTLILAFITAFTLTYGILPVIIRVAKERHLYDKPNERSSHTEITPSLGGIGIFAGMICSVVLWTPITAFGLLQYVLAALMIIILAGTLDDIKPISPLHKLLVQILVAIILVYKSEIAIRSFYGVWGINELPEIFSFILSLVAIVGIINAFNLIDGINGLAGSIGLLACVLFGGWFYAAHDIALAVVAISLAGAIIAFLKYNFTPAQIFMGDTGSLLLGTVAAILALKFMELHLNATPPPYAFQSAPAIALALLLWPVYDTLQVFTVRVAQGHSPFYPDKNHVHHHLLRAGLSHLQATATLIGINILVILLVWRLDHLGSSILICLEILIVLLATVIFKKMKKRA
jgi:UDP-GlcNAc:undecaprenyl-phosphate/decaprenyl-phosphate GlcNAc-1-phosphate transferase